MPHLGAEIRCSCRPGGAQDNHWGSEREGGASVSTLATHLSPHLHTPTRAAANGGTADD